MIHKVTPIIFGEIPEPEIPPTELMSEHEEITVRHLT